MSRFYSIALCSCIFSHEINLLVLLCKGSMGYVLDGLGLRYGGDPTPSL
jgi:hypothetical protein